MACAEREPRQERSLRNFSPRAAPGRLVGESRNRESDNAPHPDAPVPQPEHALGFQPPSSRLSKSYHSTSSLLQSTSKHRRPTPLDLWDNASTLAPLHHGKPAHAHGDQVCQCLCRRLQWLRCSLAHAQSARQLTWLSQLLSLIHI